MNEKLGTMSYRGRGRGNFHAQNNRNGTGGFPTAEQHAAANSVAVEIYGWNGASSEDCVRFISRKCKVSVMNTRIDPQSGALQGTVRLQKEADELLRWSGVKFAGQSLKIQKSNIPGSGAALTGADGAGGDAIATITQFLKQRYDANSKFLNLLNVQGDPALQAVGFFAKISTSSKFFPALMKVAEQLLIVVESVDLSANNLQDLLSVSALPHTFPQLKNLALSNNQISRLRVFETWKNKLNFLREMLVQGNPVSQNDPQGLKTELMRYFPRLVVLNGEIVRDEQRMLANLTFPFEEPQALFFQDSAIQEVSTSFIANYVNLWDTNRAGLLVLYQPELQFLMQVDLSHPHLQDNVPVDQPFGYYLPRLRNLTRVSGPKQKQQRLAVGPQQILQAFQQIPVTHHELLTKPELYSMEAHLFAPLGGIMITLHGSYEEKAPPEDLSAIQTSGFNKGRNSNHNRNKKIPLFKKSFDRTFIVLPGPNGGMIVASDLLTVRLDAGADAWKSKTDADIGKPTQGVTPVPISSPVGSATPGAATPTPADLPADIKANLNQIQQELLVQVLVETKLNFQYAIMLCEQSNWDYNQCIANFKNSMATLPANAYM